MSDNIVESQVANGCPQYGSIQGISENGVEPKDESLPKTFWSGLFPAGFFVHLKPLVWTSWPLVLTQLCQFLLPIVAMMFCGRMGPLELSSVALANSMINVSGISICVGLSAACDTLFAQINGSSNKILAGVVLQRGIITLTLAIVPMVGLMINAQRILIILGQHPLVSSLVGEYLLIFIPALLLLPTYACLTKFLQNQEIIYPTLVFGIIANIINVSLHALLMIVLDWDIIGSAIAQATSYIAMTLLNAAYVMSGRGRKGTWGGWSRACLEEWGQFANLALFGFLMTCVEWWTCEIGLFVAGLKDPTEIGVLSMMIMYESVVYMIPLGLSLSAGIYVGTYLGEGRPQHAKTVARVAITLASIIGVVLAIATVLLRDYIPLVFTNQRIVFDLVKQDLPYLALFIPIDVLCAVLAGIFRGTGHQVIGAAFITCGYTIGMCIGIPLLLKIPKSVMGFWIGITVGLTIVFTMYVTYLYTRSWEKEVKMAEERVEAVLSERGESINMHDTIDLASPTDSRGVNIKGPNGMLGRSLIWRRVLTFSLCFSVLITGVIIRLVFPPMLVDRSPLLVAQKVPNGTNGTNFR